MVSVRQLCLLTAVGIERPRLEKLDYGVDGGLGAVHLPVAADEELATHLGGFAVATAVGGEIGVAGGIPL